MESILLYALYFFALNYLVMFGAFYISNDWALRFIFRYPLRKILNENPSAEMIRSTSIGMIFHRMEASFGLGIGFTVALIAYFSQGSLRILSILSLSVAIHAFFVCLNHILNYAGFAEFCKQESLPASVRKSIGILGFASGGMTLFYGILACLGLNGT